MSSYESDSDSVDNNQSPTAAVIPVIGIKRSRDESPATPLQEGLNDVFVNPDSLADLYIDKSSIDTHKNVFIRAHEVACRKLDDPEINRYMSKESIYKPRGKVYCLKVTNDEYILVSNTYDPTKVVYLISNDEKISVNCTTQQEYIKELLTEDPSCEFIVKFIMPFLANYISGKEIFKYCYFTYNSKYIFNDTPDEPKTITLKPTSGAGIKIHRYVAISVSNVLRTGIMKFRKDKVFNLNCDSETLKWFVKSIYSGIYDFNKNIDIPQALKLLEYLQIIDVNKLSKQIIDRFNRAYGEGVIKY
ncbi:Hypothetical protein FSTVST1_239 [Faustovirus ST1]|nr:Hypothetical protein FSTVST1_239 [Faustovirus ST1]